MKRIAVRRADLIYPELSYQIIGILFDVYNSIGYGQSESAYQRAIAAAFRNSHLEFEEQKYHPLLYRNERVGACYFDFVVEDKVVLEIKKGNRFAKIHIDQLYQYLKSVKLRLGILAYFAPRKLHFKRIVNL